MALTYDSAANLKDNIARRVMRQADDGLGTDDTNIITDAYDAAISIVQGYEAYFNFDSSGSAPDSWNNWVAAEGAYIAAQIVQPDRFRVFGEVRDAAKRDAILSYNETAVDDDNSAPATFSLNALRRFVITSLARRLEFPSVQMIDEAAEWAINDVWNAKRWSWRRAFGTLSISTASAVTVSAPSGETIDKLYSRELVFDDTSGAGERIRWATADRMSRLLATVGSETGRPVWFRVIETDNALVWKFYPTPDQTYTVRAEFLRGGPPAITTDSSATPLAAFPAEFRPAIKRRVLARVMADLNLQDGPMKMAESDAEIESMMPRYDDIGRVDDNLAFDDVMGDMGILAPDGVLGGG